MFEVARAKVRTRNGAAHPRQGESLDLIFVARKAIVLSQKQGRQAQNDCKQIRAHRSEIEARSQLDLPVPADTRYLSKLRAGNCGLNASEGAAV